MLRLSSYAFKTLAALFVVSLWILSISGGI